MLLNPAGVLQGGVAALIAEVAAERVVERTVDRPLVVAGFDVRYVNMGRVGPIRAVVDPIGSVGEGRVLVRLLDAGAGDKVVTHNLIDFADPQG
jgi:acyl-coenzyme A thioesterase PaaI-like protein